MEEKKTATEEKNLISAENIFHDICTLTLNKNIEIDIIQEGLLKKVIGDEESNSIQFLEESTNTQNDLTKLNAHLLVDKINWSLCKHELRYADIHIIVDFNKKKLSYSIDNSKIHKCYHYRITLLLDHITREELPFKDSILYLYKGINDKSSMTCLCWPDGKNVDKSLREDESKHDDILNSGEIGESKIFSTGEKFEEHMDWYEEKDNLFLHKNEDIEELRKAPISYSFDQKIIFSNKENDHSDDKQSHKSSQVKHPGREVTKRAEVNMAEVNMAEANMAEANMAEVNVADDLSSDVGADAENVKQVGKEKKMGDAILNGEVKKSCPDDKEEVLENFSNEECHPVGETADVDAEDTIKPGKVESDHKDGGTIFSMKDLEEISHFLRNDYMNKKGKGGNSFMMGSRAGKYVRENEKKKKKFMKIMNENIPLTLILSDKGNEICKELINKYSRYYRDFVEECVLGCGGFGYVMKVKNKRFNITYALKKITLCSSKKGECSYVHSSSDLMNENNRYIMEEAIMIAKLQHENIVRYYDAWVENNIDYYLYDEVENNYEHVSKKKKNYTHYMEEIVNMRQYYKEKKGIDINEKYLYILMEYCPGKTLREAIDCGFIYKNEKLLWELIKQILKGLHYIHDMKIMHRDIKPSNIFLQISENILTAKIGDFGLTTRIDNNTNNINPSAGTVNYISPEQINGEHFDQKADIFSLGVVFFEMFHEPFSTLMERSIVLSNLLKGIYPDYIKSDQKIFNFLSKLLALNPQERSCAYSLLHENFLFSFEKDFTEIYNLVENKRNCEEVHTIISTLFDRVENIKEESLIKKEDMGSFQGAKMFTEESDMKKCIKKKIITSLRKRGAIFLITPMILRNKYYTNLEHCHVDGSSSSNSISKKKDLKVDNIFINTNRNDNLDNLVYLLDIYGNSVTLRPSFFFAFSEYIYENIECYNRYNESNFFFKFYTSGCTYKYPTIRSKPTKKDPPAAIYPEEAEKIFYCILISSKNVYAQEELNYLSIFSNADILVSLSTLYNHSSCLSKLIFLWSYIDLLPLILHECLDIPPDLSEEISIHLKKNYPLLGNKANITPLLQKFKISTNNLSKVSDFVYSLFQLKCENGKADEYLNSLSKFISDDLSKTGVLLPPYKNFSSVCADKINACYSTSDIAIGGGIPSANTSGNVASNSIASGNLTSGANDVSPRRVNIQPEEKTNPNPIRKVKSLLLIDKVKKINSFIGTSSVMENTCFDLFLNYEESVFSNEIIFYVIAEGKNRDIVACGGKFDRVIQHMKNGGAIATGTVLSGDLDTSVGIIHDTGSRVGEDLGNCLESDTYYGVDYNTGDSSNESKVLNVKAYGVEIYVEKIFLKVTESNEKSALNVQSTGTLEKTQVFKNILPFPNHQNVFSCSTNLIQSPVNSSPFSYSSTKVVIQVHEMSNLLIAYDLSKKLLHKSIPSYIYFSANNSSTKKKIKNFKPNKIRFIISIKSSGNNISFDAHNPIKLNDVNYKIFNSKNEDYSFMQQEELINYLIKNV
ncbi:serine/threonine protein kinase, putative [Plasmodium knowlesi strain H]|uniref:Serine/threonine protein kinase, putative n=3 Tax=Plasmodium knowlesi TaxID=5850 RepID=A0A5K1UWA7_PLAKH|nr:eukaryotic translation initiation factor 2-alpha kinase 1, putative [Plasmodium knowlesi strain H]OTN65582.1 putative Ser/Thr protein kinase [Plasmodium knowlesi]CAA9989705.1 eukaryotic translation initiation factor 2-alpha kinase 1, putative [Plasmodium knowlesi strain H]SBO22859.1 serine/threonine protein kinase, putative [Plasmodium knowlesi strain H]SBO23042.1 serine/threonine protein kinase, putative [Plasmodium knowlesi strain H]VVS79179.1 eukaryotic translation initiation factor 2-al|eukprot:XP_002260428.1 Ser/Thr protein kinase, putative [Plasmodium knowlesi strain H]